MQNGLINLEYYPLTWAYHQILSVICILGKLILYSIYCYTPNIIIIRD